MGRSAGARGAQCRCGSIAIALKLSNTAVSHVLCRAEFWFFLVLHTTVWYLNFQGYLEYEEASIPWSTVKIVSSMTTFAAVFYANQCYNRYIEVFGVTQSMLGSLCEFAYNVRLYIRPSGLPYDRVSCRWVVTCLLLALRDQRGDRTTSAGWSRLQQLNLVRKDEAEFLQTLNSRQRSLVMLHAAADLARVGMVAAKAPLEVVKVASRSILKFRSDLQEFEDLVNNNLPLAYIHLLNVMVVINLAIWAYALGMSSSLLAPACYLFLSVIVLGVLDVSAQLWNPLDNSAVDFPLTSWIQDALQNLDALMEYDHAGSEQKFVYELSDENQLRTKLHLSMDQVENILGWEGAAGPKSP